MIVVSGLIMYFHGLVSAGCLSIFCRVLLLIYSIPT